jgi:tRNA(Ile)-lysidine synthase
MADSRKPTPPTLPELPAHLLAFLHKRVAPGARVRLAYSGGRDSTVLLALLADARDAAGFTLEAHHVHHGLQPAADAWAEFAVAQCAARGVACVVRRVRVDVGRAGLEAAARSARYAALAVPGADAVLTAHHRDDQTETILYQVLRGGGPRAVSGMPAARFLAPGLPLLRPLLDVPQAVLIDYARQHRLDWLEDPSNLDTCFSRNALRHELLPGLRKRFPGVDAQLAGMAERMQETALLLDELAVLDGLPADPAGTVARYRFAQLSAPRGRNLLAAFLRHQRCRMPTPAGLEELRRQLAEAPGPLRHELGGDVFLCAAGGQVFVQKP